MFVDYGKKGVNDGSGDASEESGEKHSKGMKLQHRERIRRGTATRENSTKGETVL